MSEVNVLVGAGSIGQVIARRVSAGKHVLVVDLHQGNAEAAAEVCATPDLRSPPRPSTCPRTRRCTPRRDGHRAWRGHRGHPRRRGLTQPGVAGVVIASQSGHRLGALTADQDAARSRPRRPTSC